MREEIGERRVQGLLEGKQSHGAFKLLQDRRVLLAALCQLLGREPQRIVDPPLADELDELLLLEMEEEVAVVVEQLGMELVHERDGVGDVAALNGVSYGDAVVHFTQLRRRWKSCLVLKFFCCFLEAL